MHTALSESFFSSLEKIAGERKSFATTQHIPLRRAYLCQDCNSVGNCAEKCPACASEVLLGLAAVLNREAGVNVRPPFSEIHHMYSHTV